MLDGHLFTNEVTSDVAGCTFYFHFRSIRTWVLNTDASNTKKKLCICISFLIFHNYTLVCGCDTAKCINLSQHFLHSTVQVFRLFQVIDNLKIKKCSCLFAKMLQTDDCSSTVLSKVEDCLSNKPSSRCSLSLRSGNWKGHSEGFMSFSHTSIHVGEHPHPFLVSWVYIIFPSNHLRKGVFTFFIVSFYFARLKNQV